MRFANEPTGPQDILEKPRDKEDNMRMLLDLNGGICEVVTGVSVGAPSTFKVPNRNLTLLALDLQCFRCSKPRGTRSSPSPFLPPLLSPLLPPFHLLYRAFPIVRLVQLLFGLWSQLRP